MSSQKPVLGYLELLCSQSPVNRKDSNVLQLVDVFDGVTAIRGTRSMARARHGWPGGGARKSCLGEGPVSKKIERSSKTQQQKMDIPVKIRAKAWNKYFSKGEIQMANGYMEKCSKPLNLNHNGI